MHSPFGKTRDVQYLDAFAPQGHQSLLCELAQHTGDDLAHAAEIVRQPLVGGLQQRASLDQHAGRPLVQTLEGDLLHQDHELGHALRKEPEHEAAKRWMLCEQRIERRRRQQAQTRGLPRDATGTAGDLSKQAGLGITQDSPGSTE